MTRRDSRRPSVDEARPRVLFVDDERHVQRAFEQAAYSLGVVVELANSATQALRAVDCDILTLGQYLRPTVHHLPIDRYVTPEQFDLYREWGLARGFRECVSGPLVRSSYRAEQALNGNNAGLDNARLAAVASAATPRRE